MHVEPVGLLFVIRSLDGLITGHMDNDLVTGVLEQNAQSVLFLLLHDQHLFKMIYAALIQVHLAARFCQIRVHGTQIVCICTPKKVGQGVTSALHNSVFSYISFSPCPFNFGVFPLPLFLCLTMRTISQKYSAYKPDTYICNVSPKYPCLCFFLVQVY